MNGALRLLLFIKKPGCCLLMGLVAPSGCERRCHRLTVFKAELSKTGKTEHVAVGGCSPIPQGGLANCSPGPNVARGVFQVVYGDSSTPVRLCLWLLSPRGRSPAAGKLCGLHSLKRLLSGSLQKPFAEPPRMGTAWSAA